MLSVFSVCFLGPSESGECLAARQQVDTLHTMLHIRLFDCWRSKSVCVLNYKYKYERSERLLCVYTFGWMHVANLTAAHIICISIYIL